MGSLISGLPDLAGLMTSIGSVLSSMGGSTGLISTLAALVGTVFIFQFLYRAYDISKTGGNQQGTMMHLASPLVFGVLMLGFWQTQQGITDTLKLSSVLSPSMPAPYLTTVWAAFVTMAHGFGVIAIFRGLLIAKSSAEGGNHNASAWGAFWHTLGGVLLVNL